MGTATVATAAGMAMFLYFMFSRRLLATAESSPEKVSGGVWRKRRTSRRPTQPPANWREAAATLAETLRFTYGETLGKWPIGDLAFGIKYLMRRQGNIYAASVYAGNNCEELKGHDIMLELIELRRLIDLCYLFSKKPFPLFCQLAGYSQEDALLQEPKAGILKPAFTILRCDRSKCFLLVVRGTHGMKDTLTAVTGAVVPFHHSLVGPGGVTKLVLGYAHCGMVAAARWIAKCAMPCLRDAVHKNPHYKIKIVGHSLGGGTAALLTYIMREHEEFLSTSCVAFAPAACMTWDLAESGKPFITAIVNGTDLVPSFSTASIDDLRSEVTASSWINDLRDQVQQTPFLNVVYRSASALRARLPSISTARERVVGAGLLLRPVSTNTQQVVIRRAQNVAQAVAKTRSAFTAWSCIGARRRAVGPQSPNTNPNPNPNLTILPPQQTLISIQEETNATEALIEEDEVHSDSSRVSDTEEESSSSLLPEKEEIRVRVSHEGEITEGEELWFELEKEFQIHEESQTITREAEAEIAEIAREITEEEKEVLKEVKDENSSDQSQLLLEGQQRFYPPGRIMHMVAIPPDENQTGNDYELSGINEAWRIGIYETPRELYSKIRLSKSMINDHYMPVYKKMMEMLIDKFVKEEEEEEEEGEVGCIDQL